MIDLLGYLSFTLCVFTRNWEILRNFQDFQESENPQKIPTGRKFFKIAPENVFQKSSKISRTGPARPGPGFRGICRKAKTVISGRANVSPATFFEAEKSKIAKPKVRGKDFPPPGRRPFTFFFKMENRSRNTSQNRAKLLHFGTVDGSKRPDACLF